MERNRFQEIRYERDAEDKKEEYEAMGRHLFRDDLEVTPVKEKAEGTELGHKMNSDYLSHEIRQMKQ